MNLAENNNCFDDDDGRYFAGKLRI